MEKDNLIWRDSFFKEDFNIDKCLSKYTAKSDLETLRNDLKKYASDLHLQMGEILKTETEGIVNLAEYLTNLNAKIQDLSVPVNQLREEIKSLYDLIITNDRNYKKILDDLQSNSNLVNYLKLKFNIIQSAKCISNMIDLNSNDFIEDSIKLERAVNKYSFEYSYLNVCPVQSTSNLVEVNIVGRNLTELNNEIFLKAIEMNHPEVILRCLRMYENLGQESQVEQLIQVKIMRPILRKIFSEDLEDSNKNLEDKYQEALDFLDGKLSTLLQIIQENKELKSFNFVLNSFWTEVDKQTRDSMPYITAPGNPELFQSRYKQTRHFLLKLCRKCKNDDLIKTNESFVNYLKRFNLPVYFEIRFQQIASKFESVAVSKPGPKCYSEANDINCKLMVTFAFWKSLQSCFEEPVFIEGLADQFLKLATLLLSRYLKWLKTSLDDNGHLFLSFGEQEQFIIIACSDLQLVKNLIGCNLSNINEVNNTIYKIFPIQYRSSLLKILHLDSSLIEGTCSKLENHLISAKSEHTIKYLQNVASIPRLYRKTNRIVPKQASNYVIDAIEPILVFHKVFPNQDVLRSVCKTEESLRRLKSRNLSSAEETNTSSEIVSDESKIREQIRLDVAYFIEKLYSLGLDESKQLMKQLTNNCG